MRILMSNNPLILKLNKMPGQTFRLPSKGIPYKNGELRNDVVNGEVVVYPMTTLDEIYMKTPDMLFQGTAIEKVLSARVPQILKPKDLLAKDIDYLLTCLRKVSYGDEITITYVCNSCAEPKPASYNINVNTFMNKNKELDASKSNLINVNQFGIKLKYALFKDMIKLNQENYDDSPDALFEQLITNISLNIESIDDITDQTLIMEFLRNIPVEIQSKLVDEISKFNNWGIEFSSEIKCRHCHTVAEVPISLNPLSFFTQPSRQKTKSE